GAIGSVFERGQRGVQRQFPENGIDECCCGSLAGTLYKFDALVDGGALGDAVEPSELVKRETEGDEDFEIKLRERLRGMVCDFVIEAGAPAEDAHDQLGRQGVILSREFVLLFRVKEFGGVGGFALDAEEDVKGGCAGWGDR